MNTNLHPQDLVVSLTNRSVCSVQVAAIIVDHHGCLSWGWNNSGEDGLGQHAERHSLYRANRRRLMGATMYVAAKRKRNGKVVTAHPCEDCQKLLTKVGEVVYRNGEGEWRSLR